MTDKPYVPDFTDLNFEETLLYQPYFSYNWTNLGHYKVHTSILDTIKAWAAICTEPNEGIHFFNNPSAMFAALDLIYKIIDEAQDGYVEFTDDVRGEHREYIVPKIQEVRTSCQKASEKT